MHIVVNEMERIKNDSDLQHLGNKTQGVQCRRLLKILRIINYRLSLVGVKIYSLHSQSFKLS